MPQLIHTYKPGCSIENLSQALDVTAEIAGISQQPTYIIFNGYMQLISPNTTKEELKSIEGNFYTTAVTHEVLEASKQPVYDAHSGEDITASRCVAKQLAILHEKDVLLKYSGGQELVSPSLDAHEVSKNSLTEGGALPSRLHPRINTISAQTGLKSR